MYLQVKARNTSSFPILASEAVNVYMDGSYITKTQLKDVSPSEEFTTFLGVDPARTTAPRTFTGRRRTCVTGPQRRGRR